MEGVDKKNHTKLPFKKNILLTNTINIFNIFLFIFLKIFYDKIFFLEVDKYLRSKKLLLFFDILGISWLNYHQYNLPGVLAKTRKKNALFCDKYSVYISQKIWAGSLSTFFVNKNFLAACVNEKIHLDTSKIYEVLELALVLRQKNKVTLFRSNNLLFKEINKKYFIKNLNFINLDLFKVFRLINLVLLNISLRLLKKFFPTTLFKKKKVKKLKFKFEEKKYKVAYFPHGISSHNNIKDQFYSNKVESNFNKKNIAHIEWNYSSLKKKSSDYYSKNKLPLFFWDTSSYKNKSLIIVIKFFFFRLNLIYKFLKFSIFIEILISAYQIQIAKEKISNDFTKLKYILIGYDLLFPIQISVACKHLGIKTIALQDRILVPNWTQAMCFDYYYTIGPASKKTLKKRMGKFINFIYPINVFKKNSISLNKIKNTKKLKCLVIDFHSMEEKEWYFNGRILNNWKSNLIFYYKILSLSILYPNILFFIKSKHYSWMTITYFKDLVKILKKQKNIKILNNKKEWTLKKNINYTDFAIAKYSSLSDQMFYLNKPILIFDYDGFPGQIYDFGNKILVNNFKQLKNKISFIEKDYCHYNKSLHVIRKRLFYYRIKNNSLNKILTLFDKKLQNK